MNANTAPVAQATTPRSLAEHFGNVRALSEQLCEPLLTEDYVITPTPQIGSPVKWHLAHTTWFFERLVLEPHLAGYRPFHPQYNFFFNSYYVQLGEKQDRTQRGFVSRPTVDEVYAYRKHVNERMLALLDAMDPAQWEVLSPIITIGIHHEQQHQELMLTDIKHIFWNNPLHPVYKEQVAPSCSGVPALNWHPIAGGLHWIGHDGKGFGYDNEFARHQQYVDDFELATRLVTNGEYIEFIEDGGYRQAAHWLDRGWDTLQEQGWSHPFYWEKRQDGWWMMTLAGMRPVEPAEPVCHLSYFEADAYARWTSRQPHQGGVRLPTEAEWEIAAYNEPIAGNFVEQGVYEPVALGGSETGLRQLYGDVWEWTQSHYSAYPGYQAPPGALGEYNGKFMCGNFVLRGGSCATSISHIRRTYRNFFAPHVRWQYTGLRLARSA